MQQRRRWSSIVIGVMLTLAITVGAAAARRFELSSQRFLAIWTEPEAWEFAPTIVNAQCNVTMEGSFHSRTISKVSGSLIGYIYRAIVQHPCSGAEIWFLNGTETLPGGTRPNTLPWHLRYDSFTGTLPAITGVRFQIISHQFLFQVIGVGCQWFTDATDPAYDIMTIGAAGEVTRLRADETIESEIGGRLEGAFACGRGNWAHSARIFVGGTTTRITVRLVA
jgi:hypothetical protein